MWELKGYILSIEAIFQKYNCPLKIRKDPHPSLFYKDYITARIIIYRGIYYHMSIYSSQHEDLFGRKYITTLFGV